MKLKNVKEKLENKEISIDGANYYLLTMILEALDEIKEFLKNKNIINKNITNNNKGVKDGK